MTFPFSLQIKDYNTFTPLSNKQIQLTNIDSKQIYTQTTDSSIDLGVDSNNPKWLKVAYIPADSKDTSGTIYGVIHTSQVSNQCEKN